ncbi:3-isopropylmalate dehydratase large subunit [Pigmentiphaga litoralis]|uniref:3-isopropylmalate dehydratase large subunit n=1 Tax=Pigmentiphaga litoralis TaxID=516702 RepID=UPI003B4344D8
MNAPYPCTARAPMTAAEKVLAAASGVPYVRPGDVISPDPELVIIHDGYVESAYNELSQLGYKRIWRPERVVFVTDHEVAYASPAGALRGTRIRRIARDWGITQFFDAGRGGHGHLFPLEQGLVRPGMLLSCYDMHCTNFGAVGALALAAGAEIVSVLATGRVWEQVPHTVRIVLEGQPGAGVMARDIGFYLSTLFAAGKLAAAHDNRIIEFSGDYVERLPVAGRVALCNSLTEIGVANIWFTPSSSDLSHGGTIVTGDADAHYEATLHVDISRLAPQVALPGGPQFGVDVDQVTGTHVDHAYLGACGSGMYDDFADAAAVLRNRSVASHVRFFVVPGTVATAQRLANDGLLQVFQAAGAIVLPPGCGPCAGGVMGPLADGETSISTAATNHAGRFGSKTAQAYLGSPVTVAASAIAGRIADSRSLIPLPKGTQ